MLVIVVGLLALVVTLVLLAESRRAANTSGIVTWVRYGTGYRVVALFGVITTIYIFMDGAVRGNAMVAALMAFLFGLLAVPVFAIGFFRGVGFSSNGLCCESPWRRTRMIPWEDILGASFSVGMKQWIIVTRRQGIVRVNELAQGSQELIDELKRRGIVNKNVI